MFAEILLPQPYSFSMWNQVVTEQVGGKGSGSRRPTGGHVAYVAYVYMYIYTVGMKASALRLGVEPPIQYTISNSFPHRRNTV